MQQPSYVLSSTPPVPIYLLPVVHLAILAVNFASVDNRLLLRSLLVDVRECVMDWEKTVVLECCGEEVLPMRSRKALDWLRAWSERGRSWLIVVERLYRIKIVSTRRESSTETKILQQESYHG